ncbi:MAG: nucleoside 2-deoxyribosyltransferase [Rhodomicrobiaceae bacterium]
MADKSGKPHIYLAGPDVFFPDAMERAVRMKDHLATHGMIGWFPLDNEFDAANEPDPNDLALCIARANEKLMRDADIILANIQPWRGPEADDGTAYEIGFMAALGKLIVLYTNDARPFAERVTDDIYHGETYADGPFRRGKSDHMLIEEFGGLADNLMLINAATASASTALGEKVNPASVVQFGFEAGAALAKRLWDAQDRSRS